MKSRELVLRSAALILGLLILGVGSLTLAVPPGKDDMAVTALPSFGSAGSVSPTVPGNAPNQWFYAFSLPSGSSLNQTIPVQFQLDNTDGSTVLETVTVSFNPAGGLASFVTAPTSPFTISDNSVAQTHNILLSTGPLAPGDYAVNVQIAVTPANAAQLSHNTIHIRVHVGSHHSCFFTDSEFNFLKDCSGADVTTSSGGTFAIVANARGRVVATNPGQFYYNLIWPNPGGQATVTITLSAANLVPMGANAVHAMTFNSSGFVQDASNWDMVNQDGTPCGPSGPCTIQVNSGETLWVTWHLAYAGIGGPSAGISSTCPGNVTISATGTLSSGSTQLAVCTTTATGYLKPK